MMGQNKVHFKRFLAVLLAAVMTMAYLPAVTAAETDMEPDTEPDTELTDYIIELMKNVDIVKGKGDGMVAVKKGDTVSEDLDPAAYRFIITTNKQKNMSNSFGIDKDVTQDLNLVLRDCCIRATRDRAYSAYNDYGTAGRVKLTLEGFNELWSGDERPGLRICPGRTYEVRGQGVLSVKGGAPLGVYNNDGHADAGTLELHSGTILTEGNGKSNASIVYYGGSILASFEAPAAVTDRDGAALYPVTVNFGSPEVQPMITVDDTISVNGTELTLDDKKKAYLYLKEGTDQITFGKPGTAETVLDIPPVTAAANPEIQAAPMVELIDLTEANAVIQKGNQAGMVQVKRGDTVSADIDPKNYRFIITTNGQPWDCSFGIDYGVEQDLTLTLRDCRIHENQSPSYSAYNDNGTGRVKLTLEGLNEIWSGTRRHGIRILPGRTYEVHGPGVLSVMGGAPLGVYNETGYADAGMLELHSGTIRTEGNGKSNAAIVYYGGSMQAPLKDDAAVTDREGKTLYPVTADFSAPNVQPIISEDNTILVNGAELTLDDKKKAYLYLAEGTAQMTFGKLGTAEIPIQIPPVTTADNPEIQVEAPQLADVVINLVDSPAVIQTGTQEGTVKVFRSKTAETTDNINPLTTRFIFTTEGEIVTNSFGISKDLKQDMNFVFRDCRVRDYAQKDCSAYNDSGTGRIKLTLEGINDLWSGADRAGLRIPSGRTYEVYGPGTLTAKGGCPFGLYDNAYLSAGTLELHSGTLVTEGDDKSNAEVVYYGGSLKLLFHRPDIRVKNWEGTILYPVTVNFNAPEVQPMISPGNMILVNGMEVMLDQNKKAYLYLEEETDQITFGKLGTEEIAIPITPVTAGNNPEVIAVPGNVLSAGVIPGAVDAVLNGYYVTGYQEPRGFEYILKSDFDEQAEEQKNLVSVTLEKGQAETTLTGLQPETDYRYRVWATKTAGNTVEYGEWKDFRTQKSCHFTMTGGTVTAGTAESDGNYAGGTKITVTAAPSDSGRLYVGWYKTENGISSLVTGQRDYSFVIDTDVTLEARWGAFEDYFTIEEVDEDPVQTSFETSDEYPWMFELSESEPPCIRSGAIDGYKYTSLTLNVKVNNESGKWLFFDQMVTCDPASRRDLICTLNGKEVVGIGGPFEWQTKKLFLPAGDNIIIWEYGQNNHYGSVIDHVYLRNMRLVSTRRTVTVTGGSVTSGTRGDDGKYALNSEITVTADAPGDGQLFGGWFEDGVMVSSALAYTFVLEKDRDLKPEYYDSSPFVTIEPEPGVTASATLTSSGNQPWVAAPSDPAGASYLRSGAIGTYQSSNLTLTVECDSPKELIFEWRVSAGAGNLFRYFLGEETEQREAITGNKPDWVEKRILLPAGTSTIRWVYDKKHIYDGYDDCGYLRNVRLVSGTQPMTVTGGKVTNGKLEKSGGYMIGSKITVTADEPGAGHLFGGWYENGALVSVNAAYTFTCKDARTLEARFHAGADFFKTSPAAGVTSASLDGGGDRAWLAVESEGYLRSGVIGDMQTSSLNLNLNLSQEYNLSFQWKASSKQDEDTLSVSLDGKPLLESLSGNTEWKTQTISISPGNHTVTWEYRKDKNQKDYDDCGYLRDIQLSTTPVFALSAQPNDPSYGSVSPDVGLFAEGETVVFTATANEGYYLQYWQDQAGTRLTTEKTLTVTVAGAQTYTAVFGLISPYSNIVSKDDRDKFTFVSGEGSAWTVDADAGEARSGGAESGTSSMKANVSVAEPSLLTFEWKASCDSYSGEDKLQFLLGTQNQCEIQGVYGGWAKCAFVLDEGEHSIEWKFNGGGPYPDGENCGWVRNVSLSAPGTGRITIGLAENGSGSADVSEKPDGTQVSLTAAPDAGYACVGWKDGNGELASEKASFTAYVCGDQTFIPVFEKESVSYDAASGRAVIAVGQSYVSPVVVFAAYDSRGLLTSWETDDSGLNGGRSRIPAPDGFEPKPGERVKALVWDDLNSMKPLAEAGE